MNEQWQALHVATPRVWGTTRPRVVRIDSRLSGAQRRERGMAEADRLDRLDRLAAAERGFLRRCVGYLATDLKIRQFIDFGSRVPFTEGVQAVAREHCPDARAVRVHTGAGDAPRGRAAPLRPAAVRVECLSTGALAAQLSMRGLIDLAEPVAALLDTDLLPCDVVAHGVVRVLHAMLAPGSHLVIRQRPLNQADPYARELAAPLFEPFELLEPGLADLAWWPYPDEEVTAPGVGVLAGMARRGRG